MHSIWLVLVLSVLSSSVRAGTLGVLTYEIADGQVRITDCRQSIRGELVIPNEIEGLPVTSIGDVAFFGCESLTSINIPNSVTSIEGGAFAWCESLTSISIPDGVTSIGNGAFRSCRSLTSITIPDGVTSIGDYAFSGCFALTSITIPEGVTSIGYQAFWGCSSLTSITIPEGVTSIGNYAFFGCSSLTSITIPKAFHSRSEANRLSVGHLWPDGFFLPSSPPRKPPELSIRLAPVITVTGELDEAVTIEVADNADGPWTEWRTVVIGEEGTTEVDLDEGAEKRFYRVRD